MLPAAVGEPACQPRSRHTPPRGARPDGRERRDCDCRVGGNGDHLAGDRRRLRARLRRRSASLASGGAARPSPPETAPRRGAAELARLMAYIGFRHHLGLKFVSIALAALIWIAVAGEQTVERSLRIPLEFTNLPAQLEMVGEPPTVVDVRVRGSSGALNRIAAGELVAVLDLRAARAGQRLFHLGGEDVRSPFGVDVVQVNPSTVPMMFESSGSKTVPVVPTVEGEPADGFAVGTVTAEPSTVEVLGPVSVLSRLTQAITEPVTVTGASAPVTEMVNIGVADTSLRLRTPQTARVAVVVGPAPVEWSVSDIAVKPRNAT